MTPRLEILPKEQRELDFIKQAETLPTSDNILKIAALNALLATKLKATCDRAEYKDYFDIATILKETQISLYEGLLLMREFFGGDIPPAQILKGLTFFDDGDLHRLDKEDRRLLIDEVQKASKMLARTNDGR